MDHSLSLLGVLTPAALFAANDDAAGMLGGMACCLPFVLVTVLLIVFQVLVGWKIFTKAGRPGWESIVPIYSAWIMVTEICKKEPLWFFIMFIPFVGPLISGWVICQELAKKFGKSEGFGMGLFFLGIVFFPMLAFGDAQYQGRRSSRSSYDDDDDDYEDDRPRSRRRDDDDYDDDRPRGRRD